MKRVVAYQRKAQVIIFAQSQTTAGVWIMDGAAYAADIGDVGQIGILIDQALEVSKVDVPHPTSWKGLFDPVLKLAGAKSWSTFVKSAKCVEVELDEDGIWLIPTRNLGADGGFDRIGLHACPAMRSDATDLGHALLRALEIAE